MVFDGGTGDDGCPLPCQFIQVFCTFEVRLLCFLRFGFNYGKPAQGIDDHRVMVTDVDKMDG